MTVTKKKMSGAKVCWQQLQKKTFLFVRLSMTNCILDKNWWFFKSIILSLSKNSAFYSYCIVTDSTINKKNEKVEAIDKCEDKNV